MKLDVTCEGEVGWWTNQGKRGPAEGVSKKQKCQQSCVLAAITNYHKLGGLNNRNVVSHHSGG